jgi:hypothetical protein
MSDSSLLTEFMFAALVDIKAGRFVHVVAKPGAIDGDICIEGVIASKSSNPKEALIEHCHVEGLETANRVAIPVLLPAGLQAEEVKGFKAVRNGNSLRIEFTQ